MCNDDVLMYMQAIAEHSVRQIRMLFLLHKYNDPMDYGIYYNIHNIYIIHTVIAQLLQHMH
jgi:hypothetical protein